MASGVIDLAGACECDTFVYRGGCRCRYRCDFGHEVPVVLSAGLFQRKGAIGGIIMCPVCHEQELADEREGLESDGE